VSAFAVLRSTVEWAARFGSSGRRAVLSVGNFDGLHLGHQKILRQVIETAQAEQNIASVITFDPHPLKVLRPGQAPPLVETINQRMERFAAMGLEAALVLRFDRSLAGIGAALRIFRADRRTGDDRWRVCLQQRRAQCGC
jgi:FAD synthase